MSKRIVMFMFCTQIFSLLAYLAASAHPMLTNFEDLFSLSATSTWKEYDLNKKTVTFNKEKWAWIGSITLKSKQAMQLRQINLQWAGEKIGTLHASLYQKREKDAAVVPIEENLVCDGTWNKKKQILTFNLNEKIVAINKYYLLLSFKNNIEPKLKKGKFALSHVNPFTLVRAE